MSIPSPDDREAVRIWFVRTFPDHGYVTKIDYTTYAEALVAGSRKAREAK